MKSQVFLVLLILTISFGTANAQHHGGQQAPPISFGDKQVTVSAWLEPADFDPVKHNFGILKARFYDSNTNTNIEKVTYRIQIFSGESLLATQMFYDSDGLLEVKIAPDSKCDQKELWKCTTYQGDKDPTVPGALSSQPSSMPVIKGPVFDKSGTYTVKVSIIGATNPKTQTTEDIGFQTDISVPYIQTFIVDTASEKAQISVRAFSDKITNLQISDKTIHFEMPFHWQHPEHTSLVRNEIEIPKDVSIFQNINNFKATINGIPAFSRNVYFDPYSSKQANIISFIVTNEELKLLAKKVGDQHTMVVEITPDTSRVVKTTEAKFQNGYRAAISYDSDLSRDVQLTVAFFDQSGELAKDVRYAYSVQDSSGKEFIINTGAQSPLGILVPSGVDLKFLNIAGSGTYTLKLILIGRGLADFDSFSVSTVTLELGSSYQIPSWIKNNAKWWSEGTIGDSDFVQGIQYLVKQQIIKLPPTTQGKSTGSQIPLWIKNNAKWWAEGTIKDEDFVKGIQYLITQGIIRI